MSEMPATLCEECSFQNMTRKESRWHTSPAMRKKFMNMAIAIDGHGELRPDTNAEFFVPRRFIKHRFQNGPYQNGTSDGTQLLIPTSQLTLRALDKYVC